MQPVRRWLGRLLAPAEDPRRGAADPAGVPDPAGLLADLRQARSELAQLRAHIEQRAPGAPIAQELANEEQELQDAEESLLHQLDAQQAQAALSRAAELRFKAEC